MKTINLLVGGPTDLWPDSLRQGKIDGDWIESIEEMCG